MTLLTPAAAQLAAEVIPVLYSVALETAVLGKVITSALESVAVETPELAAPKLGDEAESVPAMSQIAVPEELSSVTCSFLPAQAVGSMFERPTRLTLNVDAPLS